jgi:hypothetical protein
MQKKSHCLLGVSLVLLLAGCGDSPQPPPPPPPEDPKPIEPIADAVKPAGEQPASPAEEMERLECEGHVQPEGAQVRLTLDANGNVLKTEALDHACNWRDPPNQRTGERPASVGEPVGTITIYAMNKDPADENHQHKGEADGSMTSHCHRWYNNRGTWILVHC